ncbi:unnamed protein product [Calicophoron daubneyi]|uniref:C2H2-type domain-containing protein n=1 Tax=Calicophoron daubneyi TaxID=300641 RepID=A0AAV2T4E5_CALDB
MHLETFAQHLACCRIGSCQDKTPTSLSITCSLYRCSRCAWISSSKNMLAEHIQDLHPDLSETDGLIAEEFTVPLAEESVTGESSVPYTSGEETHTRLGELSCVFINSLMSNDYSQMENEVAHSAAVSDNQKRSSVDGCEAYEVGNDDDQSLFEGEADDSVRYHTRSMDPKQDSDISPPSNNTIKSSLDSQIKPEQPPEEYVQLFFNETAFISAYTKNGKFGGSGKVSQNMELTGVLEKMRRFANYQVPILGRANQRRVAGCPECLKPFSHGFTDLKKHLLVTHLGVRRDITRFAIDFTHSSRSSSIVQVNPGKNQNSLPTNSQTKPSPINSQNVQTSVDKRVFGSPNSLGKRPIPATSELTTKPSSIPLATVSSDGLPTLVSSPTSAYTGSAPVHRVIPGTGVSDQHEDLRSLDEVALDAPLGRGGIVPLDEMGNPIVAAVVAANQPQSTNFGGGTEIFLPKVGRQRIQLAYSYPVFKRLLEAYQVSMPERIQLVNRMNHYARMHVVMDVLVPGGAQKRFSCPTCMYTSVHSLADIRKHIMGSHCGISTKRFRLCLRASRHDTTTYRLHTDERMIRFVEDHRRRQLQLAGSQANASASSIDSDHEEQLKMTKDERYLSNREDYNSTKQTSQAVTDCQPQSVSQEDLETEMIEAEGYDEGHFEDMRISDRVADHRFLASNHSNTAGPQQFSSDSPYDTAVAIVNDILNAHSEETTRRNEEINRRVDLPFSSNVLRILLEREGMGDQLDDIMKKMAIYSDHYLTVVSRGNRIYAYICVCGRRFAVVRDELESDIRPASLADCRRHVLGVHARIPQELLTLCCQASRISKESGYQLYADSSLLALAEQHKFRSTRMQTYSRKIDGEGLSPSALSFDSCVNGASAENVPEPPHPRSPPVSTAQSYSGLTFTTNAPSQVALRHPAAYPANHPLPPMTRAPRIRQESGDSSSADCLETDSSVNQEPPKEKPYERAEPVAANTRKLQDINVQLLADRHPGLDLDAPRGVLTPEEAAVWSEKLSLPESWTLERIVRLTYSPRVFEEQLKIVLLEGDPFIQNLQDRMHVYSRHSVYIIHQRKSHNPTQRVYVCCACLTTSPHGFGDVRKHILGVHAHVPERFKTAAMNASRLNREDYSLHTDQQLMHLSNAQWRGPTMVSSRNSLPSNLESDGNGSSRVLRRRQKSHDYSSDVQSQTASPVRKRRRSGVDAEISSTDHTMEESQDNESSLGMNSVHSQLNGRLSVPLADPDKSIREHPNSARPPIILTIPRPKAFHASRNSEHSDDLDKSLSEEFTISDNHTSCSGSRSRRSMILKSKRPCPTTS